MFKLFILLSVIYVSSATNFNCLKGPSYWCKDINTAKECQKVVECFFTKNLMLNKVGKSDVCSDCVELVTGMKSKLNPILPYVTKKEFYNLLIRTCDTLNGNFKDVCKRYVDEYATKIYDAVKQQMAPLHVCRVLQVCKGKYLNLIGKFVDDHKLGSNKTCTFCKEVLGELENLFSKIDEATFISLFKAAVCSSLPAPIKSTCTSLMDGFGDKIYMLIKSLLDGDRTCSALHLCTAQTIKATGSWECTTCVDIVTVLKKDLANVSDAEIENLAKSKVCQIVPSLLRSLCDEEIGKILPKFLQQLRSSSTPAQICGANKLCTAATYGIIQSKPVANLECSACELAIGEIKKVMLNKESIEKLKKFVTTDICPRLGSYAKDCDKYANEYMELFIQTVVTELKPEYVCKILGICDKLQRLSKFQSNGKCEICTLVFTELKKLLGNPDRQNEIKEFLKSKLCALCPEKTKCQQIIDESFSIIIDTIVAELDVDKICKLLGMCEQTVKKVGGLECEVCEKAVSELKKEILNKKNLDYFTNFVKNQICPRLGAYSKDCVKYADQYMKMLIEIIDKQLTPEFLCKSMGLCSSGRFSLIQKLKVKSNNTCQICTLVLTDVKNILSNKENQDMIKNLLKSKLCALCPAKAKCQQFIDAKFTLFVNDVIKMIDANKICKAIHLCSKTNWKQIISVKGEKECLACEVLMSEVISVVTSNDMEMSFEKFMKSDVCPRLGFIKSECMEAIQTYLPYLFRIARTSLNSKLLCSEIKFCEVPELKRIYDLARTQKVVGNESRKCQICHFVVLELKQLLSQIEIQNKIKSVIENVICPHFGTNASKCKQDIEEYYSFAINLMLDFLKPSMCSDVKLCKSSANRITAYTMPTIKSNTVNDCEICSNFYNIFKTVKETDTVNDLLLKIVYACNSYQGAVKQRCLNHVKNLHRTNQHFSKTMTETEFCKTFGSCSQQPNRVGQNPCNWGPSYWCSSEETARKCGPGAYKHCAMIVWANKVQ